jgi:hypothetical protein
MSRKARRFLIAAVALAVVAVPIAGWLIATRGFLIVLENGSSRTLTDLQFVLEDQGVQIRRPHLEPGQTARVRFSRRDPRGEEVFLEFTRKGLPGRDADRRVGMGLFATRGRAIHLRLVDVKLPDGRLGVKFEGTWSETFDLYRAYIRLRGGQWPGSNRWPSYPLDEDE